MTTSLLFHTLKRFEANSPVQQSSGWIWFGGIVLAQDLTYLSLSLVGSLVPPFNWSPNSEQFD